MKILITGANGMLAKEVIEKFKDGNELILTDVAELDITNKELLIVLHLQQLTRLKQLVKLLKK